MPYEPETFTAQISVCTKLQGVIAAIAEARMKRTLDQGRIERLERVLHRVYAELLMPTLSATLDELGLQLLWHSAWISLYTSFDVLEKAVTHDLDQLGEIERLDLKDWATSSAAQRCVLHAAAIKEMAEQHRSMEAAPSYGPRVLYLAALCILVVTRYGSLDTEQSIMKEATVLEFPEFSQAGLSIPNLLHELDVATTTGRLPPIQYNRALHRIVDVLECQSTWPVSRVLSSRLRQVFDKSAGEEIKHELLETLDSSEPSAKLTEPNVDREHAGFTTRVLLSQGGSIQDDSCDPQVSAAGRPCKNCRSRGVACEFGPEHRTRCKECRRQHRSCIASESPALHGVSGSRKRKLVQLDSDSENNTHNGLVRDKRDQGRPSSTSPRVFSHVPANTGSLLDYLPTCTSCYAASVQCTPVWGLKKCQRCLKDNLQCSKLQRPLQEHFAIPKGRTKATTLSRPSCRRCFQRNYKPCLRSLGADMPCDRCCRENRYCYSSTEGLHLLVQSDEEESDVGGTDADHEGSEHSDTESEDQSILADDKIIVVDRNNTASTAVWKEAIRRCRVCFRDQRRCFWSAGQNKCRHCTQNSRTCTMDCTGILPYKRKHSATMPYRAVRSRRRKGQQQVVTLTEDVSILSSEHDTILRDFADDAASDIEDAEDPLVVWRDWLPKKPSRPNHEERPCKR